MSRSRNLQVFINDAWEYVFCRNELKALPVITKDRKKAIREEHGDGQRLLNYFSNSYGSLEFRLTK